jgi:hypothetical protein
MLTLAYSSWHTGCQFWGYTIWIHWSRRHMSCIPRCLLHVCQLRPKLWTPRLKKCISCIPRSLLHVYNTETWKNLLNRPGSKPASRGTHTNTHTHKYGSTIQYSINWYKNYLFLLKFYIFNYYTSLFLCTTINSLNKLNCYHKNNEQNHYQSLCTN